MGSGTMFMTSFKPSLIFMLLFDRFSGHGQCKVTDRDLSLNLLSWRKNRVLSAIIEVLGLFHSSVFV